MTLKVIISIDDEFGRKWAWPMLRNCLWRISNRIPGFSWKYEMKITTEFNS